MIHVLKVGTEREETEVLNEDGNPTVATRILVALMAFGAMIAAAFLVIGKAYADPDSMDRQFLALLDRDGIAATSGAITEISVAHQICSSRMSGANEDAVVNYVYAYSHLDRVGSTAMVRDAEQVYCPGFLGGGGAVT